MFLVILIPSIQFSGITNETKEVFLNNLRKDFPRDLVPIVLAPYLYADNTELSMDKLVSDAGNMSHNLVSQIT
jgi:CCR4-NOT transcription complex subunit 1